MKYTTDILIVGSGPAGSSTAIAAARMGGKVLIVDRKTNVGVPVQCGEAVGKTGAKLSEIDIPEVSIQTSVKSFRIYSPDCHFIEYSKPEPDGYIVDRRVFDKELLARAVESGAETFIGLNVIDLIWKGGKVVGIKGHYLGEPIEIRSKIVVGADGVNSTIARKTGLRKIIPIKDLESCASYEMVGVHFDDIQTLEFYFSSEIAPKGYVWIFPKGENRANVGLGVSGGTGETTAKDYLDYFVKNHSMGSQKCGDAKPIEFRVGAIPLGGPNKKNVIDNVLLVGDAAGQVHPITGGGISYSMVCGSYAGKVTVESITKGDTSESSLQEYETLWRNRYEDEFKTTLKLKKVLVDTDDDTLNRLAKVLHGQAIVELTAGRKAKILMKTLATGDKKLIALMTKFRNLKLI